MMRTPIFLPFGLLAASLCTRAALQRRAGAFQAPPARDWWLLLVVGWLPLFAWILHQWVEQY